MEIKDLIFDSTSSLGLEKAQEGKVTFYLGVDPTADSIHLGHLSTIIFAKKLIEKGNKAILIIGGATARIGDPSGKKSERELLADDVIDSNAKKLTLQIKKYFNQEVLILNNNDWLGKMTLPIFLRDYGKLFNISSMIKKDIVASRLDSGISYTEFTYQVLQAMDFKHLSQNYKCDMQIGGQDQWGNITSGLELIRKTNTSNEAFGLTLPLITKDDGTKFGKSEEGTIWLDKNKTTPYQLYQFLKNIPDGQVLNLIKRLTLVEESKFIKLQYEVENNSKERVAQNYLADQIVEFVHSQDDLIRAKEISDILFSGDISQLSYSELNSCLSDVPSTRLQSIELDIQDLLVEVKAAKSRREAREFIANDSIMLNGKKIKSNSLIIKPQDAFDNKLHVIKRGKRKFFLGKY